jgi:hypothetical protein
MDRFAHSLRDATLCKIVHDFDSPTTTIVGLTILQYEVQYHRPIDGVDAEYTGKLPVFGLGDSQPWARLMQGRPPVMMLIYLGPIKASVSSGNLANLTVAYLPLVRTPE